MQEQAGKTSRASTRSAYRAYARMVNMVIELIRQFYDAPRTFRIIGAGGEEQYEMLDNSGLMPQHQGMVNGVDMGYRLPVFDVEVSTQKMTAYTKLAQNEMALQMYQLEQANAGAGLTCLVENMTSRQPYFLAFVQEAGLKSPFAAGRILEVKETLQNVLKG
jgi:hypothetical protein